MSNLPEELTTELKRCRELLEIYQKLPTGLVGAWFIGEEIAQAEAALASHDVVEMIRALTTLRKCE